MPEMSAPASRRRPSAAAGKSAPLRATIPTSPVQARAAAAACTELPPSVPIWLVPSGWITSSIVRLPTMMTGRRTAGEAGCATRLLRGDLFEGQVQVNAAPLVDQIGADVPEHPRRHHAEHELHRQVRGHGEGGAD